MTESTAIIATPGIMPASHKPLFDSVSSRFEDSKFSDFVIQCEGKTWKVHKIIVGGQSTVLGAACNGNFKEGREGVITLKDDDKDVVNEMLRYLYTTDFEDDNKHATTDPMLFCVRIHIIADKYNIPALAKLATIKYADRLETGWGSEDFANSIEEMYATAPHSNKPLQACAISAAVKHAKELYEQKELGKSFREVVSKTPEFASDFASAVVTKNIIWPVSKMRIWVQTLTRKKVEIQTKPRHTIHRIKELVQDKEGIPPGHQGLIFEDKQLDDDATAAECHLTEGCTVYLVLTLRGS